MCYFVDCCAGGLVVGVLLRRLLVGSFGLCLLGLIVGWFSFGLGWVFCGGLVWVLGFRSAFRCWFGC